VENVEEYKSIFFSIINGYSSVFHSYFGQIFIKHLSYIELAQFDTQYEVHLNEFKSLGIPTYKEKEKQIIENGLWKDNDEINLEINEKIIQDLRINYSKDYLYSRRKNLKKEIESYQNKINSLRLKKSYHIGQIAEEFANKKLIYDKIINSFFRDKQCLNLLINNDDIDDEKYEELQKLYYINQEKLNADNIKKISLSPFFTNIFYLCEDNAYSFYGKPIISLSNYQCDLVLFGRYFKNIISQRQDIPKEIMSNPNELIEWIEIRGNAERAGIIGDNNESDGSMSVVGAQKKDLEILGIKTEQRFSLSKELEKSGGKLDADALFNLTK
jgi:hypothetical protein